MYASYRDAAGWRSAERVPNTVTMRHVGIDLTRLYEVEGGSSFEDLYGRHPAPL